MLLIRETFTTKPGMASKFAAFMKQTVGAQPDIQARVLVDVVGTFNTVVLETEAKDLGEFEKRMAEYSQRKDIQEQMKGYTDMYVEGKREIYRVV